MNTRPALRAALLSACWALPCVLAQAALPFCNNHPPQAGGAGGSVQCAATGVYVSDNNAAPGLVSPDQSGPGQVVAHKAAVGDSPVFGASLAVAQAVASPGVLRSLSTAQSIVVMDMGGGAFAETVATSLDYGRIMGLPGAQVGDLVSLHFSFAAEGVFAYNGSASLNFSLYRDWAIPVQSVGLSLNRVNSSGLVEFDINWLRVGDHLGFQSSLTTSALVSAVFPGDEDLGNRYAAADVMNTARLHVDVLSGNATIVSSSGYLYGINDINPPVPELPTWALLGAGLVLLRWRRR